jgi:regulator of extracellular matrix RemA (YlzA/DUF370 family)
MNVLLVIVAGKVRAATIVRLIEQTRSPAQLVQPGYGSKPRRLSIVIDRAGSYLTAHQ